MPRCCVDGCESGSFKEVNRTKAAGQRVKSFFTFPKSEELQNKWKQIIYDTLDVDVNKAKICELHFKDADIVKYDDTVLRDGTIHRMHRQRFLLRKGAIPDLSIKFKDDDRILINPILDENLAHHSINGDPLIVCQDEFLTKLVKKVENGINGQNQKETVIVDLTNHQQEMYQNNFDISFDSDVFNEKDLFQVHSIQEVNLDDEKLMFPELHNFVTINKSNNGLNTVIQDTSKSDNNHIPTLIIHNDKIRERDNVQIHSNHSEYILTGDIPEYQREIGQFPTKKNTIAVKILDDPKTEITFDEKPLEYNFFQLKNDLKNKQLNISSSWAHSFTQDNSTVTFSYVHPLKLVIHLYCIIDASMKIKISPYDRKVYKEEYKIFKTSHEFSEYLTKLEKTKCCEGTGIRNTFSKRCQGFISFDNEYKRSRGYQRCRFCRELRKRTLHREDNFFNIELRMREQNCKIRTLQYKYSQLQKFMIRREKISSRKKV